MRKMQIFHSKALLNPLLKSFACLSLRAFMSALANKSTHPHLIKHLNLSIALRLLLTFFPSNELKKRLALKIKGESLD
jgi:hypothetical protein